MPILALDQDPVACQQTTSPSAQVSSWLLVAENIIETPEGVDLMDISVRNIRSPFPECGSRVPAERGETLGWRHTRCEVRRPIVGNRWYTIVIDGLIRGT